MDDNKMQYDFETILDRSKKDSLATDCVPERFIDIKTDSSFSKIPMWVADMSFVTCPSVLESVKKRLEMPNFGYYSMSDEYYSSIIEWHKRNKPIDNLSRQCVGFENGVLGGVAASVVANTKEGDCVLVNSPTYTGFTETFKDIKRTLVHSPLVRDEDGLWRIDYEDMDKKIKQYNIKIVLLCSPHNPTGRVWEKWELEKVVDVCEKNNCIIISDEIWSDIILFDNVHIPTLNISEYAHYNTIALYSPSKTFSIAGLEGAYHVIFNEDLRSKVESLSVMTHYNNCNVLSMHALIGGYSNEGLEWKNQMIDVIENNMNYAFSWFKTNTPEVRVVKAQGTYMIFPDTELWCKKHNVSFDDILTRAVKCGVIWQSGEDFLMKNAIRINLALPFSLLKTAFERLKKYVFI